MILKGSQRAGGMQLAAHLLNDNDNDHVTIHELRGFVSENLAGAFKEAYAVSCGTRCKQFLFSLSLSPPESASVPVEVFEGAIAAIEEKMGLTDQPRAIVFHEKEGRRHAHCVWSRIDIETMTAINLPHYKLKLRDISRQLYLENEWRMPSGLANSEERNPLNFIRAEWQQAKRVGIDPRKIKEAFQDCWAMSDGLKSFRAAMEARGYYLAQGDRRGIVAVDWRGEIYAISRYVGIRTKDVRDKLGAPDQLPSVAETKESIAKEVALKLRSFKSELKQEFEKGRIGLKSKRDSVVSIQRKQRADLLERQQRRRVEESRNRSERFRKGLAGIWDWMTGKRSEIKRQNELELADCVIRDRNERQRLIERHLEERRELQNQIVSLRKRLEQEYRRLEDPARDSDTDDLSSTKRLRMSFDLK